MGMENVKHHATKKYIKRRDQLLDVSRAAFYAL